MVMLVLQTHKLSKLGLELGLGLGLGLGLHDLDNSQIIVRQ